MNILNLVKAHSPLLRALVYAGVVAYGIAKADMMVERWSEVQFASIQGDGAAFKDSSLAGCVTDTECETAERAALLAVSKVRGAR